MQYYTRNKNLMNQSIKKEEHIGYRTSLQQGQDSIFQREENLLLKIPLLMMTSINNTSFMTLFYCL